MFCGSVLCFSVCGLLLGVVTFASAQSTLTALLPSAVVNKTRSLQVEAALLEPYSYSVRVRNHHRVPVQYLGFRCGDNTSVEAAPAPQVVLAPGTVREFIFSRPHDRQGNMLPCTLMLETVVFTSGSMEGNLQAGNLLKSSFDRRWNVRR